MPANLTPQYFKAEERYKTARAWGKRFHDGQPVGRDTVLEDGDLLEFHE